MNLLQTLPIDRLHQYHKSWKDGTDWNSISWLTGPESYLKPILDSASFGIYNGLAILGFAILFLENTILVQLVN